MFFGCASCSPIDERYSSVEPLKLAARRSLASQGSGAGRGSISVRTVSYDPEGTLPGVPPPPGTRFAAPSIDLANGIRDILFESDSEESSRQAAAQDSKATVFLQEPDAAYRVGWVHDSESNTCMWCDRLFTRVKRRHHCRACGALVCADCSTRELPIKGLKPGPHRVCDHCYDNYQLEEEQADAQVVYETEELWKKQESLRRKKQQAQQAQQEKLKAEEEAAARQAQQRQQQSPPPTPPKKLASVFPKVPVEEDEDAPSAADTPSPPPRDSQTGAAASGDGSASGPAAGKRKQRRGSQIVVSATDEGEGTDAEKEEHIIRSVGAAVVDFILLELITQVEVELELEEELAREDMGPEPDTDLSPTRNTVAVPADVSWSNKFHAGRGFDSDTLKLFFGDKYDPDQDKKETTPIGANPRASVVYTAAVNDLLVQEARSRRRSTF